jgi:hypothetical protein
MKGPAGKDAINKARKCYRQICLDMQRRLCEFLAQVLILVEGSERRIAERLQSIGFVALGSAYPSIQPGPLLFLSGVMIFALLGVISIFPVPAQAIARPLPITAILIVTTQLIALFAAILPKLLWRTRLFHGRGYLGYVGWVLWATMAALVTLIFERAVLGIVHHAFSAVLDFRIYPLTPLAPLAFANCLSVAILCDAYLRLEREWTRRILEGLLCGVAMVFALFV